MAYIPKSPYDALLGNQQVAGASQDGGATGATPAAGGGASTPSTGSGQFVNFQRVLDANKGQGAKMAGQLATSVQKQGQSTQANLDTAQQQFKDSAAAGTVTWDRNGGSDYRPPTAPTGSYTAPAAPAYTSGASSDGVGTRVTGGLTGGRTLKAPEAIPYTPFDYGNTTGAQQAVATPYSGYKSLTETPGYADLSVQAAKTSDAANGLRTGSGVQAELQQMYGGQGGYGAGSSRFDALLAQGEGGQQFQSTAQRFGGLSNLLTTAAKNTAPADAAIATTTDAQTRAQQYLNDKKANEAQNADVTQRNAAAQQDYQDQYSYQQYRAAQADKMQNFTRFVHGETQGPPLMTFEQWRQKTGRVAPFTPTTP